MKKNLLGTFLTLSSGVKKEVFYTKYAKGRLLQKKR